MTLSEKQELLLKFVQQQHGEQKRKYILTPYWEHPLAVATAVNDLGQCAFEIALCHDLIEDTPCTAELLAIRLRSFGYEPNDVALIVYGVIELTDFYTSKLFPDLNRKKRKTLEAIRIGRTSPVAQSIKCADISDNIGSILEYDMDFAKTYIPEKDEILYHMQNADLVLYKQCQYSVKEAFKKIS